MDLIINNKDLAFFALGGLGEVGKNMYVLQYQKQIFLIDAGILFPDEHLLGVDYVMQDLTYLIQNEEKIVGLFITHGHEDHIGGIPFLLKKVKIPKIYASGIAVDLIQNKLIEYKDMPPVQIVEYKSHYTYQFKDVELSFIRLNHSIPDSFCLVFKTPYGNFVHTGDFKIDLTPINGEVINLTRFAELGKKGVALLMCESTNVERPGISMSEKTVGKTLDNLFEDLVDKRIFVATFASNIHRLQQIMDLAVKYKRKIAFSGRSMINVSETALKLNELKFSRDNIIDIDKIDKFADKELIIITTGSQGEEMSALTRMANDDFNKVHLGENDVVIVSASPIPGNEKAINTVINKLYRKGVEVIYNELADVHVSGHAYQEELKIMHALVKPKFFIPVHGEYRHLKLHQTLAMSLGMNESDIIIPDIGMKVEVNPEYVKIAGSVPAGERLVDGTGLGDATSVVLRDRKLLSEDGLCVVVLTISQYSGEILSKPEIISRGFIYQDEASELITEARDVVVSAMQGVDMKSLDPNIIKQMVKKTLSTYFFKKTKRRPMILAILQQR